MDTKDEKFKDYESIDEVIDWYNKENDDWEEEKRKRAIEKDMRRYYRLRARERGDKADMDIKQISTTPSVYEKRHRYRRICMIETMQRLYGDSIFDKLVAKTTDYAFDDTLQGQAAGTFAQSRIDTAKFLLERICPKPTYKSFVKFDLLKIKDIDSLEKAFISILEQQASAELSIEDAKHITAQLVQLKDFILGTRIESQYTELLNKLSETAAVWQKGPK